MKTLFFIRQNLTFAAAFLLAVVITLPLYAQQKKDDEETNARIKNRELQKATASPRAELPKWSEDDEDDFGKLLTLKKSKPWWVTPFASARGFWTSNALLGARAEKGDSVFVETQGFNAGYRINKEWSVQAGYNYSMTRYSENMVLDTDANSCDLSTSYQLPWNWQVSAGDRALWIKSPDQGVEVYREHNPFVSVVQSWGFLENRLNAFYGYEYDHKFTNPVGFERDEHTLFAGASYSWMNNLVSQLVLRQNWQLYDFRSSAAPVNGRQEWVTTLALQTVWQPLSWLQVSAFWLNIYGNSVNSTRDYKAANAGGEIKVFWKF